MHSLAFMTLIKMATLTTKNSPQAYLEVEPVPDHQQKVAQVAQVAAATPKSCSTNSEGNLHPEVQEASLASESNSESWMITTVEL